jgi:hypothetical protein
MDHKVHQVAHADDALGSAGVARRFPQLSLEIAVPSQLIDAAFGFAYSCCRFYLHPLVLTFGCTSASKQVAITSRHWATHRS